MTFNNALGEELMAILLEAYTKQSGIHGYRPETHAPQHLFWPQGMQKGDLAWRRWMARAAGTDRRTVSMRHYASHVELNKKFPELYTKRASTYKPALVEHLLRTENISMPKQTSQYWRVFAHTLAKEFGDEPLNMYRGGSIDSVLEFKAKFKKEEGYEPLPGYGAKISSLFAMFLEEYGLLKIDDALPVDLHVQRIFISTGIITLQESVVNEYLENAIRLFLCELCARKGWSRVELAHALWFLGNKGCTTCYRNADRELTCALYGNCQGRASSVKYFGKGLWDPEMPSHRKGGSRMFLLQPVPDDSPQQPLFKED